MIPVFLDDQPFRVIGTLENLPGMVRRHDAVFFAVKYKNVGNSGQRFRDIKKVFADIKLRSAVRRRMRGLSGIPDVSAHYRSGYGNHGRQAQFDLWGLDETSLLRTRAGLPALLVIEGEARPARWLRLQRLLGPLRPLGVRTHERGGTTRSFGFWAGRVSTGPAPPRRATR